MKYVGTLTLTIDLRARDDKEALESLKGILWEIQQKLAGKVKGATWETPVPVEHKHAEEV